MNIVYINENVGKGTIGKALSFKSKCPFTKIGYFLRMLEPNLEFSD